MRWWKWAGQGWMTGPKGLSKVTESKYLSESSWEDTGWGPGRFWAWLSFPLQQSPTWAVVVSMGAHSLWQMCFFLPAMNNSLLVASCITSHVVFGQDAALDTSDCKLPHDCRSTLYGLCRGTCQTTHPHSHPSAGSTRPCLLCVGPLAHGLSLLPALWREVIFSSPWVPSLPPSAWALLPVHSSSVGYQHHE